MSIYRVCERQKLRVNVVKINFTRCTRYVNVCRMVVRLNFKPLEEADCSKYLGWRTQKSQASNLLEIDLTVRPGYYYYYYSSYTE